LKCYLGKIRDELLAIEEFATLHGAKIMTEDLRRQYNADQLYSTPKHQTPNTKHQTQDEFKVESSNSIFRLMAILTH